MAPLGALTQPWTASDGALPLVWPIAGGWRFDESWISLGDGPAFYVYASGSGRFVEQALHRLGDRLAERRGRQSG